MFYRILTKIGSIFLNIFYNIEVEGLSNLNTDDKLILCSNHKSILDPIVLAAVIKQPIHFIAKKELFRFPPLRFVLNKLNAIPIDRKSVDKNTIRRSVDIVNNNGLLGIFIEGTRVKEYDPNNAKAGVIMLARLSKSYILPVYIDTDYNIFGKINITIRPKQKIDLSKFSGSNSEKYSEQAKEILRIIYDR